MTFPRLHPFLRSRLGSGARETSRRGRRVLMLLENNAYPQDDRPRRQAQMLTGAGYEVSIICPARRGQPSRELIDGVWAYRYPAPPDGMGLLAYAWEYGYATVATFAISLYLLATRGFDIIHAHNPPDTFFAVGAAYKLLGKKFVFDQHDLSPEMYQARQGGQGSRLVYRALELLEALSCRVADRVIATNDSYKAVQMARGKVPEERITVVRNGPDIERLQPVPPDAELRRRAGTIIGYVGTLGPQDSVDHLLRAVWHLVNTLGNRDVLCIIVGKGDMLASLRDLARDLGIEDHVWFTGWISDDDLVRYLCTADVCVDPDPSNPFNDRSTMVKMMEYMALGRPIVAFDLPEHRVTAQEAAVYARPNDELDLARQIAALMTDPPRREAMGRLGRQRVQEELAWPHQTRHLLAAYAALEAGGRTTAEAAS